MMRERMERKGIKERMKNEEMEGNEREIYTQ